MKCCADCDAFKPTQAPDKNGMVIGECRARPPKIIIKFKTQDGSSWQAGWPPTKSSDWCREFSLKVGLHSVKKEEKQ